VGGLEGGGFKKNLVGLSKIFSVGNAPCMQNQQNVNDLVKQWYDYE
jgi:hypothetical protein